jgi:hypothetical protein
LTFQIPYFALYPLVVSQYRLSAFVVLLAACVGRSWKAKANSTKKKFKIKRDQVAHFSRQRLSFQPIVGSYFGP